MRPGARYDGLDAVRALAMLLGIGYHALTAYQPGIGPWYVVEDVSTHWAFDVAAKVLHAVRMPVFFVLSGFFAHLLAERRGEAFLADRARRLLVPLAVAAPLVVVADFGLRQWAKAVGRLVMTDAWLVRPLHVWFLEYLFLFCAVAWALRRWGPRVCSIEAATKGFATANVADPTAVPSGRPDEQRSPTWKKALQFPECILGLALVTGAVLRFLPEPKPSDSFVPQLATLLYYLPCFGLGWLLWLGREELPKLGRLRWWLVPGLVLGAFLFSRHLQWEPLGAWLAGAVTWLSVAGLLGWAVRLPEANRPWLDAVIERSYWVYLVHHPLVVAGHVALATAALPCGVKYLVVVGSVTALSFASWALVRRTPLAPWLALKTRRGLASGQ